MAYRGIGSFGTAWDKWDKNQFGGGGLLLFTELTHAIYPHLSGERNTAAFMRDMLERLSSVPEELWFTSRGKTPGEDHSDESLRKWFNRGLTKTLARRMLANPTRDNFVDSFNYVNDIETESADEVKAALAASIADFTDEDVDENNVGDVLFDLFQQSFEFIVAPELENDRKVRQAESISDAAKRKFGSRLLEECKYTCSRTGCGQYLQQPASNDIAVPNYAIVRIAGDSRGYLNLLALCPECFHSYVIAHKKADETELSKIKKIQVRSAQSRKLLSTVDIERGISKVVEKLGNANLKEFEDLSYDPVAVKDKIDEQVDHFLYDEVMFHVTRYFRFIEEQMQEEARLKTFDDDLLRSQIKAISRKLLDNGCSLSRVHNDLTEKISRITKQDRRYCAFIVSYFIQSCEVLDASA